MSQDTVELVRSAYEAYNRRDVEGVLSCFDEDIDWDVPDSLAWGDHVRGLEAIGRFFEGLKPYMGEDHKVAIDDLIDGGDRVVALCHHRGTAPNGASATRISAPRGSGFASERSPKGASEARPGSF